MDPTIIGVIGCGTISDAYLLGAARSKLVRVKLVADIRPGRRPLCRSRGL